MGDVARAVTPPLFPRVSAIELLSDALAAAQNHPEGAELQLDSPMHPEDAWTAAASLLSAVAGLRAAQWEAVRAEWGRSKTK